jgi:hypothetical protein
VNRLVHAASLCGLLSLACSHMSGVDRRKLEDGSYRVSCRVSLAQCVNAIEEVCTTGYDVVQAREDRRLYGPLEPNQPVVTSEVVARCRVPAPVFGGAGEKASQPAAGGSAPAAATRSCVPGATQACVGRAACKGGQQCLPDGSGFGPCDCGGAADATPAPPSPPAPQPDEGSPPR